MVFAGFFFKTVYATPDSDDDQSYPVVKTPVAVCEVLLTVDEVALLLPDKKGVAQGREDEAGQDLAGT